jgi:hypothetical protein
MWSSTVARAEADRLRSPVEELSRDLARAEEQVSRLVIARRKSQAAGPTPLGSTPLLVFDAREHA